MSSFAPLGDDSDSPASHSSASTGTDSITSSTTSASLSSSLSAAAVTTSSSSSSSSFSSTLSSLAPLNPHISSSSLHQQIDRSFSLDSESELRIFIDGGQRPLSLRLLSGKAEIFGMELLNDKEYTLTDSHTQFSIFSWYGAQIKISGDIKKIEMIPANFNENSNSMRNYLNAHIALEEMRKNAILRLQQAGAVETKEKAEIKGPRILIVGPTDMGKSSLAKILINYAVRAGHKPIFVDLDVGQNSISVSGSISATSVEQPIGLETFSNNCSDFLHIKSPLTFFHGHPSPSIGLDYYLRLCETLAKAVERRCLANEISRTSGIIINTCGWVEGDGYEAIIEIAKAFSVTNLFVITNSDSLVSSLKGDARLNTNVIISRLPRSNSINLRDANTRRAARMRSIRFYFHGPLSSIQLHPASRIFSFRECEIYRVTGIKGAKEAAAAIAAAQQLHLQPENTKSSEGAQKAATALATLSGKRFEKSKVVRVTNFTLDMQHSIMAVMYPQDPADIAESSVAGFVHIQNIDLQKKTIQLLTPSAGPLPSKLFLLGTMKWFD